MLHYSVGVLVQTTSGFLNDKRPREDTEQLSAPCLRIYSSVFLVNVCVFSLHRSLHQRLPFIEYKMYFLVSDNFPQMAHQKRFIERKYRQELKEMRWEREHQEKEPDETEDIKK